MEFEAQPNYLPAKIKQNKSITLWKKRTESRAPPPVYRSQHPGYILKLLDRQSKRKRDPYSGEKTISGDLLQDDSNLALTGNDFQAASRNTLKEVKENVLKLRD